MITVVSGSNRPNNNSLKLATHVAGLYRGLGEAVTVLDLFRIPPEALMSEGYGEKPESFKEDFVAPVLNSMGLVLIVPEYNGSYPGVLKYFIDLLPFPEAFDCRPVAFIGHSGGYWGALRSVEQLQMVFAYRNAYLFNRRVFIPVVRKIFNEQGGIINEEIKERLAVQANRFLAFTRAIKSIS